MEYSLLRRSVHVEKPFGPYLDDTIEKSPMTWIHRHRHLFLWTLISVFAAYRFYVGHLWTDITQLLSCTGDLNVPLWIASLIFFSQLEIARIAVNPKFGFRSAFALYMVIQATMTFAVASVLMYYRVRTLSSGILGFFWAMMVLKCHSFFAWYRITNHAVAGQSKLEDGRVFGSRHAHHGKEDHTSFLSFIPQPSLVYDPYPIMMQPRYKRALSEFLASFGSVLLLHFINVTVNYPLLKQHPHLMLPEALSDPIGSAVQFLKLLGPVHVIVLLLFYAVWHCGMTTMAELTGYADRTRFYGPFWREPLLGNYFRLWSAPVHSWLKRHCLDDVLRQQVLPMRVPHRHPVPADCIMPTEPTSPIQSHKILGGAATPTATAAQVSPSSTDAKVPTPAPVQRSRPSKTMRIVAAATVYIVSAFVHEAVFFMCTHIISWPTFFMALLTLALYTSVERRFGQMFPHMFVVTCVLIGHCALFAEVSYVIMSALGVSA